MTVLETTPATTIGALTREVHTARLRAQRKANTELLQLWWRIGRTILDQQTAQGDDPELLSRL
ncbi:MAG: DUF1016 domain-containing protein, partial [Microbacterium sp.]|nr:DUF1016 domain-containing protein [Microbacterium sp.]